VFAPTLKLGGVTTQADNLESSAEKPVFLTLNLCLPRIETGHRVTAQANNFESSAEKCVCPILNLCLPRIETGHEVTAQANNLESSAAKCVCPILNLCLSRIEIRTRSHSMGQLELLVNAMVFIG